MSEPPNNEWERLLGGIDGTRNNPNPIGRLLSGRSVEPPVPIPPARKLGSLLQPPVPRQGLLGGPLGRLPLTAPTKTSLSNTTLAGERFEKNLRRLKEEIPVGNGRVVPDVDDLKIGDAKRLKGVAVLFLDICRFSAIGSGDAEEQDRVFMLLNLFMAEMLHVVRDHEGDFEKNTGDGLMSYFGGGSEEECAKRAVDAAVTMHCYNDYVLSPKLLSNNFSKVKFRVGIETGLITIAHIGIRGGGHDSLVAVGNIPNVACKLMTLLPEEGIVLGNYTRNLLPTDWQTATKPTKPLPNFVSRGTTELYPAWELTYRAPDPAGTVPGSWYGSASRLGGAGGGGLLGGGGLGGLLGGSK